jgi:hypothetical protein
MAPMHGLGDLDVTVDLDVTDARRLLAVAGPRLAYGSSL